VTDYLPVLLSVDHPYPKIEQWIADRFEALNNRKMLIIRRDMLPDEALLGHPTYAKAWLWDVVPEDTQRIMYIDFDAAPIRAMPEIPDVPFAAVPDAPWWVSQMCAAHPLFARNKHVFNAGFFVMRRDTKPVFEQLKGFMLNMGFRDPYNGTYEQMPMNHLIQVNFKVHWLPGNVHCLVHSSYDEVADARLIHFPGTPNKARWASMELLRIALGTRAIDDAKPEDPAAE